MKYKFYLPSVILPLVLTACNQEPTEPSAAKTPMPSNSPTSRLNADTGRWYSSEQVAQGKMVFAENCASCHGANAEATPNWKTPDANGDYPPPPLNGSAHAWHHPLAVLDQVIREGTATMGGNMPAWGKQLNQAQRLSVIASFQDYWNDEIYEIWLERENNSRGN